MTEHDHISAPTSAREVLAYFVRNPQATDSLEGIARWRIQQEAINHTVEQVSRALAWLVDLGFLVREAPTGVTPTFRLNTTRATDAERLVADLESDTPIPDHAAGADDSATVTHAPVEAPATPGALMLQSLAWVDATLLRYHRRQPASTSDLPGLTKSRASIESALAPRAQQPSGEAGSAPHDVDPSTAALMAAFDGVVEYEPLAALYHNLTLTPLELQTLLLCLAPEVDAKYQSVYGILNDDLGRRAMTLGLACAILGEPLDVRQALSQSGGLTRWRLLEHGATLPHADDPLRLDASIVAWLLGDHDALVADARLSPVLRTHAWVGAGWFRRPADLDLIQHLTERLSRQTPSREWIALSGPDVDGAGAAIEGAAAAAGIPAVRITVPSLAAMNAVDIHDTVARLTCAVQLAGAVPILDLAAARTEGIDLVPVVTPLIDALADPGRPGVLVASDVQRVLGALPQDRTELVDRQPPDDEARAAAFTAAAADAGLSLDADDAARLALAYPLPLGAIADAVRLATLQGVPSDGPAEHGRVLAAACRHLAAPELPRFARRVEPIFRLTDVVLPRDQHAQLAEMTAHVRYASQVLQTWGFGAQLPYGRGVAALFCGPSGTGKTMAAQAIAHELQTDAYVVDLSRLVSKYIGESEKNLDAVFTDAERAGAVLVIDEADALFGKRTEIKDAHDRYANIEVAYLLQRMELFAGLAILTTNFRRNMDDAFLRRLRFVVEFPKPDAQAREAIWRQCLPVGAPVDHGVNLRLLARRLELTGGNIRQITIRAAFAAAAAKAGAIEMRHVLSAARAELRKLGQQSAERELAEFEAVERQRTASRVA